GRGRVVGGAVAGRGLCAGDVTERTAAWPAALSGVGGVMATFLLGRRMFGPRAALMASVVLATSWGYFWHARFVLADMTVACFVAWSAWAFWRAQEESPAGGGRAGALTALGAMALFYLLVAPAPSAQGPGRPR